MLETLISEELTHFQGMKLRTPAKTPSETSETRQLGADTIDPQRPPRWNLQLPSLRTDRRRPPHFGPRPSSGSHSEETTSLLTSATRPAVYPSRASSNSYNRSGDDLRFDNSQPPTASAITIKDNHRPPSPVYPADNPTKNYNHHNHNHNHNHNRPIRDGHGRSAPGTRIAEGISVASPRKRKEVSAETRGFRNPRAAAVGMSSTGASDKRRSTHVLRPASTATSGGGGGGGTSRSRRGSSSGLIAPPPKALHASPAGGSSPPQGDDGSSGHDTPSGSGSIKEGNAGTVASSSGTNTSSSAVAALASALKEKDEKIAHLERELSVMETEFARELDRLSQNESETAVFWQGKHSALNQQFLRADTELRLLRAEVEVRRGEREELREGWEALRAQLREKDAEMAGLRAQVRGLKEWVSTSTRSDAQTTDEVFGEGMARLGNGLQNWVIVHFRKSKLDLSNAGPDVLEELGTLVPMYEELVSTARVHLLQSLVSAILVDMVFNAYFFGLSKEQTSHFRQVEQLLRSLSTSDEAINQWRASTLSLIHRDADHTLATPTSDLTAAVVSRINATLGAITDAQASPARDQALQGLVQSSASLARLLAVQKAEFWVWMPDMAAHMRTPFEDATMEDIGGEEDDEDGLATREIWCVAFPGVIKRGDESGGHLQYENVIAKARVLCRPE